MEMTKNGAFVELSDNEMMMVDGGDKYKQEMIRKYKLTTSKEDQKKAISYTIGYVSIAVSTFSPFVGTAISLFGLFYGCS